MAFTGDLALDPHSPFVPNFLRTAIKQRERHDEAFRVHEVFAHEKETFVRAFEALQEQCQSKATRREAEKAVARYIQDQVLPIVQPGDDDADRLHMLPRDLRDCRCTGPWGMKPDGGQIIAWDAKCGELRLCPDEAREEQQRLAQKYVPQLLALDKAGYKIQKWVISPPNVSVNDYQLDGFECVTLASAQRYLFDRWRQVAMRSRKNGGQRFPIAGSLVVMESPLSSHGDWNVHLNVFVAIEPGQHCSWGDFREALGGWQCDFKTKDDMIAATRRRLEASGKDVPAMTDDDVFTQALLECVKYPVQTVAEKGSKHDGEWIDGVFTNAAGEAVAPPMTKWPPERFLEWYRAQRGFRRTRGYGKGVLFAVRAPERETLNLDDVKWLGQVRLVGRGYIATLPHFDLIPGDKSPKSDESQSGQVDKTGPPDRPPDRELSTFELARLEILDQELTEAGI